MENLLNNEPVKRVKNFITKFDPNLKILILNTTARTAKDASEALKCDVGAIIKSLLLKVDKSHDVLFDNFRVFTSEVLDS